MSQVRIEHVSKHYDDVAVLQDINLAIPHGAVLALLGPSLSAPLTGSEVFLSVHGSCMAFSAQPGFARP